LHVIPDVLIAKVSRGENTVACCRPCNNRKDDRTPEEAGMPLRIKPYKPHSLLTFTHTRKAAWLPYLGP